ncbi:ABC transporter ATP-binding protein [Mycoplasma sp. 4423]
MNHKISLFSITYGTRILFLVTILLGVSSIILETYMPLFVKDITDTVSDAFKNYNDKYHIVLKNAALLVSFGILIGGFTMLSSYLNVIARYRFAKNLRLKLFSKIQTFSFEDMDKFSTGVIVNRLNTDIDNIVKLYGIMGRPLFRLPIMFISSLVFAITQSGVLSIIFAVSLPLLFGFFLIMWKYGIPIFYKTFKKSDQYNTKLQENLNSMRLIKSYVTENQEAQNHDAVNNQMRDINIKGEKVFTWYHIVIMNTIFMSVIALVVIGVNQVLAQKIKIGTITAFSTYIWMITGSFLGILNISGELFRSIPSAKRYNELIKHQVSIIEKKTCINKEILGEIEFKNVYLKYHGNSFNSLENINIKIKVGQSIGIIGATSSGKSSLLSLIPRFYDATDGNVLIDGIDVKDYSFASLRSGISAVFQDTSLFLGSIRDNIKWGNPDASDEQIIDVLKQVCIWDFVASQKEQLDYQILQGGKNLSGGQKQRLYLARALIKNPKILLLDDATSALDAKTEKSILSVLNNIKTTKIIVSQKIASLAICDQIVVIENGMITNVGTHNELIKTNSYYQKLNMLQGALGGLDAK